VAGLRARAALGCCLTAQALLLARHYRTVRATPWHNLDIVLVTTPLFVAALILLARSNLRPRQGAALVVLVGALLQAVALLAPPRTSDDDYRYIWDAKVQLAGIDPYRYAPTAPQLAPLRDRTLFPYGARCPQLVDGTCPRINRPTVRTVYPPVAEGAFDAIRVVSLGWQGNQLPLQLAAAVGAIVVAWLLSRRALARGRPIWHAAVWAWCPITISEFGNNAHIDWLAVIFVLLGLTWYAQRREGLAGVVIGAAIATKLYPALVLPSMLRRRPITVLGAAAGLVALSYLPHVLAVGTQVIGYLPGYLREEQYVSGGRLLLLGQIVPHPLDTLLGLVILGAAAGWAWRRSDPDRPEDSAVVVVGVAFLVMTPNYSWYAALLVALVALSGAIEWLPVAFASTATYLSGAIAPHSPVPNWSYLVAAALTGVGVLTRRRRLVRSPARLPAPQPVPATYGEE
jgi:hypothetical protein